MPCVTGRCFSSLASRDSETTFKYSTSHPFTGATTTPGSNSGAALSNTVTTAVIPNFTLQHERFAKLWDKKLRRQGFAEAFERQHHT